MGKVLYLEGPLGAGKTPRLVGAAAELLATHPTGQVLVFCSNHSRQQAFQQALLQRLDKPMGQLPVYTYPGYVRNLLFHLWPMVESRLGANAPQQGARSAAQMLPFQIVPLLTGMEDSEWLLAELLAHARQAQTVTFQDFPGSDRGLVKQLVRRLRLRSENRLSRPEMRRRSALLAEICQNETALLEQQFDRTSFQLRSLDSSKQLDVFHTLLESEPWVQDFFRQRIRHLVVDDMDETTPAHQAFVRFLAPTVETLLLAADLEGGSRRGYLNAYPYDWPGLKAVRADGETFTLKRNDAMAASAEALLANWRKTEDFQPLVEETVRLKTPTLTRVEMVDQVVADVEALLAEETEPGQIALVLPRAEGLWTLPLLARLQKLNVPVQLLSGTRRPSDNPLCLGFLNLLQWANSPTWQCPPSPLEFKAILVHLLKLNRLDRQGLEALVAAYNPQATPLEVAVGPAAMLRTMLASLPQPLMPVAQERLESLAAWLEIAPNLPFEKQLYSAFHHVVARFASEEEPLSDLGRVLQSYPRRKTMRERLDTVLSGTSDSTSHHPFNHHTFDRTWLLQVKQGTVADSPSVPEAEDPNAMVIATPQKLIDMEVRRPLQLWLDVSSREWCRSDNAPLYHGWVHSAVWDGETTSLDEAFQESVLRARAGHITRTLMLLAKEKVIAYQSELDDEGFSQSGHLSQRLVVPSSAPSITAASLSAVTLRSDQAPVLDYRAGTMAISAVPGAGKTFVNVALILHLIQQGVPPENILVLTYMDSAAKTLLRRIKHRLAEAGLSNLRLPVISTIHSLAFRILVENDHAIALNRLPDEMDILDERAKEALLQQVAQQAPPSAESGSRLDAYAWARAVGRGIDQAKAHGLTPEALQARLREGIGFRTQEFLPAYQLYQEKLRETGQLDFTDLIVLAVQLLEQRPDIREKYQLQFRYVLEDEAQDSSRLLQRLISLLGGKTPNLVRTGDTNQSITTTFSSADPAVFREFIQAAQTRVLMDQSSRCAPEVMALANHWVLEAPRREPALAEAFIPVTMKPVAGKNPALLFPIAARNFEREDQELSWLVVSIQAFQQQHPEASVAVLVRWNNDVRTITARLQQAGVPTVSLSDTLNQHPVFSVLLAWLNVLVQPSDPERRTGLYQAMARAQHPAVLAHGAEEAQDILTVLRETPLFHLRPDALPPQPFLQQLYYDCLDFNRASASPDVVALLVQMTDRLFTSVADRSNGYLCALQAQEVLKQHKGLLESQTLSPLELVIHHFQQLQHTPRGRRPFQEEELLQPTVGGQNFVQVMTLHKAKGQEFDAVFLPFLTESRFRHQPQNLRLDEEDRLLMELDQLALGDNRQNVPQNQEATDRLQAAHKTAIVSEEARLVYVGLTRARRALFCSTHQSTLTRYGKLRPTEAALAFQVVSDFLSPPSPSSIVIARSEPHCTAMGESDVAISSTENDYKIKVEEKIPHGR